MSDLRALSLRDADLNDPAAVDAYDELPLWSALAGQLLFRYLPLTRDRTVLDIGCGTGFPAIELAERLGVGSSVTGIDTWEEALKRAGRKAAARNVVNISFVNGDASAMPFPDRAFDLIVSNLGVNNFEDPVAGLRECRRVARAGATLALTTNLSGHWLEFYAIFDSILDESMRPALRRHIEHRVTVDRLHALLTASRFRVVSVEKEVAAMRFADGSAFLEHSFVRLGFFPAWRDLIAPEHREEIFARLETALNAEARAKGHLTFTVPFAYLEAVAVEAEPR
jgi:ubiquinone/menaquinone biosynthesis C-methylase UbiE